MDTVRFRDPQFDYVLGRSLHTGLFILTERDGEPYRIVRAADAAPILARIRWTPSQSRALDFLLPASRDDREQRLALLVAELDAPMARYQLLRRPRRRPRREVSEEPRQSGSPSRS